jgi:hypothetical protein
LLRIIVNNILKKLWCRCWSFKLSEHSEAMAARKHY